ncbi:hypothetical protein B0H17DRAFT_707856 [Mycena rosella]|uniref:Uncharacterized protein n=1 Tax=Mycena rosella TaxID=1033263 RepID=A0AAD7DAF3_MYCRO|nr:hypothetical protein B0H17DRAFT_707856 [Mycena rosella]
MRKGGGGVATKRDGCSGMEGECKERSTAGTYVDYKVKARWVKGINSVERASGAATADIRGTHTARSIFIHLRMLVYAGGSSTVSGSSSGRCAVLGPASACWMIFTGRIWRIGPLLRVLVDMLPDGSGVALRLSLVMPLTGRPSASVSPLVRGPSAVSPPTDARPAPAVGPRP